jgi:hypothetical protein
MRKVRTGLILAAALGLVAACQSQAAAGMQTVKSGDNYQILAETRADPKDPLAGVLAIVIRPTGGWKMDREKGPAGFVLEPPEAVQIAKKDWQKTDAKWEEGGKQIRFEVPYKLSARGTHALKIQFRFVVCTDTLCQMKRFEQAYSLKG